VRIFEERGRNTTTFTGDFVMIGVTWRSFYARFEAVVGVL
jgi:hypothetical protein